MIALIAIGRMENRYAREWVEHHLRMGFDHIIICDNNHDGEERFEDVLQEYIDKGRVEVLDYRNQVSAQRKAYTECYARYGGQYEWIAFFDFDEFLCINAALPQDVHELMKRYNHHRQVIMVPWVVYTDSGLIHDDGRPVRERFTEINEQASTAGKGIVRGGINGVSYKKSVHVPWQPVLRCYNPLGQQVQQKRYAKMNTDVCWLAHYTTKTIEEYLSNKAQKGTAGRSMKKFKKTYGDYFFSVNKRTPEKEAFIEQWNKDHQ